MRRDAIISLFIALPAANLPFWQWRSPAEMLLMAGLFWQVAFVLVVGTVRKDPGSAAPAGSDGRSNTRILRSYYIEKQKEKQAK